MVDDHDLRREVLPGCPEVAEEDAPLAPELPGHDPGAAPEPEGPARPVEGCRNDGRRRDAVRVMVGMDLHELLGEEVVSELFCICLESHTRQRERRISAVSGL